jgi:sulfatase maturation enzyme AslB (radical SAM superfamily)
MAITEVHSRGADQPAPLTAARPWEQHCGDCAFLPVCLGGCLGGQYLRTGRVDQVHCRKPEIEASYREGIVGLYRAELGAREWQLAGG